MNEDFEAVKTLATEIIITTKQMIDNAPFNRTVKAPIIAYLGANKYQIQINGEKYPATSEGVYSIGDIVNVIVCNNNFNNLIIQSSLNRTNVSSSWELETDPIDI